MSVALSLALRPPWCPRWRLLPLVGAALLLAAPGLRAAEPAPQTAPQVLATAAAADPMSQLKQRLEQRLGAVRAPDAVGTHELRVPARQPPAPAARPAPGRPDRAAPPRAEPPALQGAPAEKIEARAQGERALHWDYTGDAGPAQWGAMRPEFALCASGQRQSPIDILDGIAVDLQPVHFDYRAGGFSVIDNGHTVQVNVAPGNAIEVTGRRYELQQFHFHRPSEERIQGRQFDMSVHLVHRDPEGRIAIVAVLLERGAAQPVVQQVWNNLPLERHEEVPAAEALDPSALLPADRRYYTYMGSQTTPPCNEGVLWMVMQQPVPVAAQQIGIFSRLYPMNARPVQQAAGRLIKQSN